MGEKEAKRQSRGNIGQKRARTRNIPPDVMKEIVSGVDRNLGPTAIHGGLVSKFEGSRASDVPSLRTVGEVTRELRPRDDTEAWQLSDEPSKDIDPALVLPVLARLMIDSDRRRHSLTIREAQWVTRVGRAGPGIPPMTAFRLAREYMRCEDSGRGTADLDFAVGARVWEPGREEDFEWLYRQRLGELSGDRIAFLLKDER